MNHINQTPLCDEQGSTYSPFQLGQVNCYYKGRFHANKRVMRHSRNVGEGPWLVSSVSSLMSVQYELAAECLWAKDDSHEHASWPTLVLRDLLSK